MTTQIRIGGGSLSLDGQGRVSALASPEGDPLLQTPGPFLQLGVEGRLLPPLTLHDEGGRLRFAFPGGREALVSFREEEGHTAFCVEQLKGSADTLTVGPLFCKPCEEIGDVVGVVQGGRWAMGIQALNAKTLAGFPAGLERSPLVAEGPVSELSVAPMPYESSAAYAACAGGEACSLLQLYCENRRRTRRRDIMTYRDVQVAPLETADADIAGMAFALFCCGRKGALDVIGRLEEREGLPHPTLDGEWLKTSRKASQSYLIAEFGPANLEKLLAHTRQAGLSCLYHPEPFSTWGHFVLREDWFPEGDRSLRECCETAKKAGVRLGLHTLSAFTTPADGYVSPLPDPRLAKLGGSALSEAVDAETTVLPLEETGIFTAVTTLQTVRLGTELVRYRAVENGALTGCVRGAFGTGAASHAAGERAELLCDHPYRVFFPELSLQDAYSERLAELFRETGAGQISFDGLEGCAAAGEDAYGLNRFCLSCWEGWGRSDVINDASRLNHNLWHMHTRMNWGEPWGAKMREGMLSYRIKNQDFYRRNLFPRMLGWFLLRKADRRFEATTPEDIEWALSMAAGFDAGFALSASEAVLDANGCTDELLEAVKSWEALRMAGAFPEELRERLRDPATEWHLERGEAGGYRLYPLGISAPLVCDLLELQPGQPGGADWVYENPFAAQPLEFRMRVEGYGEITEPTFVTRGGMLRFPCTVRGGQYLWYRGGKGRICDRNLRPLCEAVPVGTGRVEAGQQALSFSCGFGGEEGPEVTVRVFTYGEPLMLQEAAIPKREEQRCSD